MIKSHGTKHYSSNFSLFPLLQVCLTYLEPRNLISFWWNFDILTKRHRLPSYIDITLEIVQIDSSDRRSSTCFWAILLTCQNMTLTLSATRWHARFRVRVRVITSQNIVFTVLTCFQIRIAAFAPARRRQLAWCVTPPSELILLHKARM